MANPNLIDGYDKNDINTAPIPSFLIENGYADGQAVEAIEHNEIFKQLFDAANKNKNDGIWDWEDPTTNDTEYNKGSLVNYLGETYQSLVDSNTVTPIDDGVNWERVKKTKLWQNQATTITPPTDADYTLTADENTYGRFVLDLSNWTTTHNIIVDNSERSFIVDNSAGAYTATIKTSAGTGVAVLPTTAWLLCDGTNVIEPVANKTGFKNLIINGDGRINQREYISGTATTTANEYTLDRWRVVTLGQNLTFSTTENVTTMTLPSGGIEQVIEGLNFGSGTYTISFVATGDTVCTVDGVTKVSGDTFTLTGGTNATVKFSSASETGTVKLIQVESGTIATPFEQRPIGLELSLCQRYYEVVEVGATRVFYRTIIGALSAAFNLFYKTTKRTTPTLSTSGLSVSNGTIGVVATTTDSIRIDCTPNASNIAVNPVGYIAADSEL